MGSSQIRVGKPFLLPRGYSGCGEQKDTKEGRNHKVELKYEVKERGLWGLRGQPSQAENAQF